MSLNSDFANTNVKMDYTMGHLYFNKAPYHV